MGCSSQSDSQSAGMAIVDTTTTTTTTTTTEGTVGRNRTKDRGGERLDQFKCSDVLMSKPHQEKLNTNQKANAFAFHLNDRCCLMYDHRGTNAQVFCSHSFTKPAFFTVC